MTYRVAGARGVGPAAVAAVAVWQLVVALAEEMYYRGFLQSGMQSGLAGVGVGALAADAVALVFASALFGAVHALWVADGAEDGDGGGGDKLEWFLETGAWGLLYGSVFVLGGHNLAAPLLAHAAQNTWWCCEDARAMGRAPAPVLRGLFEDGEGEGDMEGE